MTALLFVLTAQAIYTDLKTLTVSNINVLGIVFLGIAIQAREIEAGRQTWQGAGLVAAVALGYGFVFFLLQVWAAGDGKLFWALTLAAPIGTLTPWPLQFPSRMFIITTVMTFAYVLIVRWRPIMTGAVYDLKQLRSRWQQSRATVIKETFLDMGGSAVRFVSFVSIASVLSLVTREPPTIIQSLIVAAGFRWGSESAEGYWRWVLVGAPVLLHLTLWLILPLQPAPWSLNLVTSYVTVLIAAKVSGAITRALHSRRPAAHIQVGTFLGGYIIRNGQDKVSVLPSGAVTAQNRKRLQIILGPEDGALSPEAIVTLRSLIENQQLSPDEKIPTSLSIPFAPFIALSWALLVLPELVTRYFR